MGIGVGAGAVGGTGGGIDVSVDGLGLYKASESVVGSWLVSVG